VLLGGGLAAGFAIGHSPVAGYQQQLATAHHNLLTEQTKLATEKALLSTEQSQVHTARQTAQNAVSAANLAAASKYAGREAAVQALQRKLQKELGTVQHNTISADGVYVVGRDIASGTYHTTGGNQCYYATLGSTDTSNILDNNIFNGPETVDVSGAYAFDISGGCTWVKIS
jgi:multidrug efflux pump subunit AcrA (membrane-fusion protein)